VSSPVGRKPSTIPAWKWFPD